MVVRSRLCLIPGIVLLALLALPQLALAKPGGGPELAQLSGRFVVLHADERDGASTHEPMLVNGLGETPVRTPPGVWINPGARVRLQGTMRNGTLVVADSLSSVRQLAPSPNLASSTSASPSLESTAIVMFYFHNQTASALPTTSAAGATMNTGPSSLRGYYLEQTYGDVAFQADVLAPVQLAENAPTTGDCFDSIFDWAQEAYSLEPGSFDPSPYRHVVFAFPALSPSVCGWSGLAEVGGTHVWTNGSFTVPVLAHELGHNLGLDHAGGLSCTSSGTPAPMGDLCAIDRVHYGLPQYADPFDAMGNAPVLRQMNMAHKLALGLLPPTAVQTISGSGTYLLAPMETLGGTVELLILPRPGGGHYYVEYRQPLGTFDGQAGSPAATGVLVHTESPDTSDPDPQNHDDSDTALLDMHPDAGFPATQWQNAALGAGQTFTDPVTGLTIQSLTQSPAGASLAIGLPVDTQPPGPPQRLSAVTSGTSVALQWTAATDNYGVQSYRVSRNGSQVGAPVDSVFTDTGLMPGSTLTYAVTAVDAAGNAGSPATISVSLPDTLAPGAPTGVKAVVGSDGDVRISWGAAADNVAVTSYRVLRAGTGIVQANVLSYVDKAPRAGTGPTVTYSVVAFDAVGNASPPASAQPLRSALLRPLGASRITLSRARPGKPMHVKGTLSDAEASCRVRFVRGAWHRCKVAPSGAFAVTLRRTRDVFLTLALRDEAGRTRLQSLHVR